jgi:AcrR family transcriptional regulator
MKKKSGAVALRSRHQPSQQRAKESVDAILTTAAALLDEVGVDGFNTNLLAERAGVRIRTVYRYFPNKYAVIIALTETLSVHWDEWMGVCYERLANAEIDWKYALRAARVEWLRNAQKVPGALSVLQAMNATPELKELHFKIFEGMSLKVATALRTRGLRLPAAKRLAIGRTVVNAMNTGMDVHLRLPEKEAKEFIAELGNSQEAYLSLYLRPKMERPG